MKITKSKLAAASFGAALTTLYAAPELSAQVSIGMPAIDSLPNTPLSFTPDTVPYYTGPGSADVGINVVINGVTNYGIGPSTQNFNAFNNSDYGFGVRNSSIGVAGFERLSNAPTSFFLLDSGVAFSGFTTYDNLAGQNGYSSIGETDSGARGTGIQNIGFVTGLGQVGYFRVDLGDGTVDAQIIDGEFAPDGPDGGDFTVTIPSGGGGPMVLIGDVNLDGSVGFGDIPSFIDRVLTSTFQAEADITGDGEVGFDDIVPFIDLILGTSEVSFSGSGDDVAIDEEAVKLQLREQLIAAVAEAKGLDAPAPASAGLAALALGAVGLRRRRKAATTAA